MRRPRGGIDPQQLMTNWREAVQRPRNGEHRLRCRTLTPLYGGGVEAGKVDAELPIRVSGLRGQWRFWWRLLHRGDRSPEELFDVEAALWGGIGPSGARASKVSVRLREVPEATSAPAFEYKKRPDGRYRGLPDPAPGINAYALFPGRGELTNGGHTIATMPAQIAKPGLEFELQIDCPEVHWPVVEAALRWWASFGGVGARTRRGLGAVQVEGLSPVTVEEVQQAGGRLVLGRPGADAMDAWNKAVNAFRDFRQGPGIGRRPGHETNRPGRSHWPEPDAIRRLSKKHGTGHEPEHPVRDFFPRAAFGLPIVFHFKDPGEPGDHILEPGGDVDRMASPLILRSYWDGSQYRPSALLLPGWERALAQRLKFKGSAHQGHSVWPADTALWTAQADLIHPMKGRGDDPLNAFLGFFRQELG